MTHPIDDELLLLAYGELPDSRSVSIESHVAGCPACQGKLVQLERGRAALDIAMPRVRRRTALVSGTLALAAAALIAAVLINTRAPSSHPIERWSATTSWSTTAGYVTGGRAMIDIDAQLTRLEQERYYGSPN